MSQTIAISERALSQRINRALSREDASTLCKNRPNSQAQHQLGEYFVVNDRNIVTSTHVDLVQWGREMGVLRAYEVLAEETTC